MKVIDCFDGEFWFLSNFAESPFVGGDGITYPTNEHFFQAMKTNSMEERKAIAAAKTPGEAKRMGRKVELRSNWEENKLDVMRDGLKRKFDTHKDLRELLLATGDAELIEGTTWHDNTWGNCSCEKCKNIPGKNYLGKCLMELRESYRK